MKSLNYAELDLIIKELALVGYRLQQVKQLTTTALVLECYGDKKLRHLVFNVEKNQPLIYELATKYQQGAMAHPFTLQLRKLLLGAKIVDIQQPNQQRVIIITVEKGQSYHLVFKLWTNHSNLFLCDQGFRIINSYYPHQESAVIALPEATALPLVTIRVFQGFLKDSLAKEIEQDKQEHQRVQQEQQRQQREQQRIKLEKSLQNSLQHNANASHYQLLASLIQINKQFIQRGMASVRVINYTNDQPITIALNPKLNAVENAQYYYKKYHKQQQAYRYAEQQLALLATQPVALPATCVPTVPPTKEKRPGLHLVLEGYTLLIGRNANENDELLRHYCRGLDWFFHVRDFSGGYVIVKTTSQQPLPLAIKWAACALASYYSKARQQSDLFITYTQIKYLRRIKGGKKGAVSISYSQELFYKVDELALKNLLTQL